MIAIFTFFIITNLINDYSRPDHAIYVSVIEIEKPEDSNIAALRFKIFADDLEDAIYNQSGIRVDLLKGDCNNAQKLIENYLEEYFKLTINSTYVDREYISCELNDISLWLEFTMNTPGEWHEVEVHAGYLMELFPTQTNVVSITFNESKKLFRLTNDKTTETVKF